MISIQQATHLSNTSTQKLASFLNQLTPKGSGVEPNYRTKFALAGKSLEEFFMSPLKTWTAKETQSKEK